MTRWKSFCKELSGATFADAERVCLDIRKSCALRGDRQLREEDIVESLQRYSYRRSILEKASNSKTPVIDKE